MPSLRSINKEIGTNFKRWKEVTGVLADAESALERCESCKSVSDDMKYDIEGVALCPSCWADLENAEPLPEEPTPPAVPEPDDVPAREYVPETLAEHPDIAKMLAMGYSIADVQNGRNAARRQHTKIRAAARHYGSRSDEVQEAINEANRLSALLTTARAAYNRITYPERYR